MLNSLFNTFHHGQQHGTDGPSRHACLTDTQIFLSRKKGSKCPTADASGSFTCTAARPTPPVPACTSTHDPALQAKALRRASSAVTMTVGGVEAWTPVMAGVIGTMAAVGACTWLPRHPTASPIIASPAATFTRLRKRQKKARKTRTRHPHAGCISAPLQSTVVSWSYPHSHSKMNAPLHQVEIAHRWPVLSAEGHTPFSIRCHKSMGCSMSWCSMVDLRIERR